MSVKYKILMAALLLGFSIAFIGSEQSQAQTVAKPKFGDGVLEEVSEAMEGLLQLEWDGRNLALKRDWDKKPKKKKSKKEELEDAIEQLVEQGVPEDHARLMVERAGNGRGGMPGFGHGIGQSGVEKAFNAVKSKAGANSMGSSSSGKEKRVRFSGQTLSGRAILANHDVRFEFTEIQGKERSFEIRDDGEGEFKFEFSFDELFVRLVQSKTGKTQLIWIDSDKVDAYIGDSFSGFMKGNPKVASELLFPLFDRLGIRTPTGPPDP